MGKGSLDALRLSDLRNTNITEVPPESFFCLGGSQSLIGLTETQGPTDKVPDGRGGHEQQNKNILDSNPKNKANIHESELI